VTGKMILAGKMTKKKRAQKPVLPQRRRSQKRPEKRTTVKGTVKLEKKLPQIREKGQKNLVGVPPSQKDEKTNSKQFYCIVL